MPATVVQGGQAEFGISWVPRMLAPRVGRRPGRHRPDLPALADAPGVVQGQGHHEAEDLAGKKVGSWGFGNESELYAGLRKAGLDPDNPDDVTIVAQQFDMVAFEAGRSTPPRR